MTRAKTTSGKTECRQRRSEVPPRIIAMGMATMGGRTQRLMIDISLQISRHTIPKCC